MSDSFNVMESIPESHPQTPKRNGSSKKHKPPPREEEAVEKEEGEGPSSLSVWRTLGWFAANSSSNIDPENVDVSILIEVVSALDLIPPKANATTANPYCTIKYANAGKREKILHKTSSAKKTLSPIWTVKSKSLFLLKASNAQIETYGGLVFEVLHGDFSHGSVMVPIANVMEGRGERLEFPLSKDGKKNGGILALRFRRASTRDIQFMKDPPEQIKKEASPSCSPTRAIKADAPEVEANVTLSFRDVSESRPGKFARRTRKLASGETQVRVQPSPDPDDEANTTWMTESELNEACLRPSKKWIECGKGSIGKIYLEILGCDGLPNLDVGGLDSRNVTDPFIAIVYEDSLVRTDVITDSLSPRWMPWSQRAFIFDIKHPTSILIIGAFDYDSPAFADHDPIGRLVINHQNLRSKTVYLLKYALYSDTNQEEQCGTVSVRVRVAWNNEKERIQKSFAAPPRFQINVKSKKSLRVLRYLCKGQVNMEKTSAKTVGLHASEYFSYFYVYCYAIDVLIGVLLWRGSMTISIRKPDWIKSEEEDNDGGSRELLNGSSKDGNETEKKELLSAREIPAEEERIKFDVWFPIHSILLFIAGTSVVEDVSLLPSVFFFTIGWILFVIGYHHSYDPSPWHRCNSFYEISSILLVGHHVHFPVNIKPNDGEADSAALRALAQARVDRVVTFLKALKDVIMRFKNEYAATDSEAHTIETPDTDWTHPFAQKLYYLHLFLSLNNKLLRMISNVLSWRSSLSSYYLTIDFFAIGIVAFFLPWDFVILWSSRVFVWSIFGPWMKLLDKYYIQKYYRTDEELMKNPEPVEPDIDSFFKDEKYKRLEHMVRVAKEDSEKMKAMREFRYGEFNQIVPMVDQSRYPSIPLPESTAAPFRKKGHKDKKGYDYLPEDQVQRSHVIGQKLAGNMIHTPYEFGFENESHSDSDDDFDQLSLQ